MIILSANNITKSYGTFDVLKDVSFIVNEGDRIGIVGANGAGKTTLLNILTGEIAADSGNFFVSQDKTAGFLKQKDNFCPQGTLYEETTAIFSDVIRIENELERTSGEITALSAQGKDVSGLIHKYDELHEKFNRQDGYRYRSDIEGILASFDFGADHYSKKVSQLSGGEKTRLALACLLLRKPDLLFLDEPTNHLDISTLKWFEQHLKAYSGTMLIISHDRYFLDQVVNRVFEIENHKLYAYEGNYTAFAEKKRARREEEARKYEQYRKETARQEEMIRRFKQHGTEKLAKRALSREKRLEHIDAVDAPSPEAGKMKIRFKHNFFSGYDVLLCENVSKSFSDSAGKKKKLFENVEFDIKRGEKICIIGPNGAGKTTLLKIIIGELDADDGFIKRGHNTAFGYYEQSQTGLTENNTLLGELTEAYRLYSDTEMRSILGRFLFKDDSVFQSVSSLSGGEKARLSIVKLMLSGANVLILDEPTNHLDIVSKEVFEDALKEFSGTVIAVSHDRYFLNKIPDRIFELGESGITTYLGAFDYYDEKKQAMEVFIKTGKNEKKISTAAERRMLNKKKESEVRREERQKTRLEAEIHEIENRIKSIEEEMLIERNITDHILLAGLYKELSMLKAKLEEKYAEWLG